MVALPQPFDARTVDPSVGTYQALPDGWYDVVITASEYKTNREKTGGYVQFDRKVINCADRSHVGKIFPERLNLQNPSAQAMEIAQKCLSAICHVTGVHMLSDTAQLHNIPHRVRLDTAYSDKEPTKAIGNNVKEYADVNGNVPGKAGAGPAAVSPQGTHTNVAQPPQPPPTPGAWAGAQPTAPAPQPAPAPAWGAPAGPAAAPAPAAWG